MYKE